MLVKSASGCTLNVFWLSCHIAPLSQQPYMHPLRLQIGFPFQYSQSLYRSKVFMLHVGIRMAFHAAASLVGLGTVLNKPAIMMMYGNRYTTVWKRAQRTTAIYVAMASAIVTWLITPGVGALFKALAFSSIAAALWAATTSTLVRSWAYSIGAALPNE